MTSSHRYRFVLAALALAPGCGFASAADGLVPPVSNMEKAHEFRVNEVRFAVTGHDFPGAEKRTWDLQGDVLTSRFVDLPEGNVWKYFVPRAVAGVSANLYGKTSYAYAGVAWTIPLGQNFFIEGDFGAGAHNGKWDVDTRANLGHCHWTFREMGAVGYHLNEAWSVMADVEHESHAGLCKGFNSGMTSVGVRLSYAF